METGPVHLYRNVVNVAITRDLISSKVNYCQPPLVSTEEVIPGWEVAVKSMRRNERSQFLIAPDYAFGPMGCPPRIPPNATSESEFLQS